MSISKHESTPITPNLHRMATVTRIKNKGGIVWRAQVHVNGRRESSRLDTKADAQRWAYERETELRKGGRLVNGKTLGDAFRRYASEIPDTKKGKRWELVRLKKLEGDKIAKVPAAELCIEDGEAFIERALASGLAPNTVIREMALIKPVVRRMTRWKWSAAYPWDGLKMPKAGKPRSKLYTQGEISLILEHAGLVENEPATTAMQEVAIAFIVGTESGMRLNEICSIVDDWWNRPARYVSLPDSATKTGSAREVPLSTKAHDALSRLTVGAAGRLFKVRAQTASTLFRRIRRRAGIHDGTFHDSRHYAVTKLSKKLDIMELAAIIGHSDINQLQTYYEADAAEMAKKLD